MPVGIPGSGLGGFFYLLSIGVILVYEIFLLAQGKSNKKRWQRILPHLFIALGMLAAIIASDYMLDFIFRSFSQTYSKPGPHAGTIQIYHFYLKPIFVPFMLLGVVLIVIQAFYFIMTTKKSSANRSST